MWVRPATAADGNAVAELVAADRPTMLSAPRPLPRIGGAHESLRCLYVAHDGSGQVLGAMALHRHARPGASAEEVTWLHCREDPAVAAVLVRAVREKTADRRTVAAFSHPTEWPPHVPGLALHNRPVACSAGRTTPGNLPAPDSPWPQARIGRPVTGPGSTIVRRGPGRTIAGTTRRHSTRPAHLPSTVDDEAGRFWPTLLFTSLRPASNGVGSLRSESAVVGSDRLSPA